MFAAALPPGQVGRFASLLVLAALLSLPSSVSAQIRYKVISRSQSGSARQPLTPRMEIIRSDAELQALWRALGRNVAPPEVDFRNHSVIAYFLGIRSSTGYRLEAERVEIRAGTMTVNLIEISPGNCCVSGLTATMPDIWISTVPWKGPVKIEVRQEPHSCCP